MNHVYVLLYHDVWDIGKATPGNPTGEPETVTIEGVFAKLTSAQAAKKASVNAYPDDRELNYYTIEKQVVFP